MNCTKNHISIFKVFEKDGPQKEKKTLKHNNSCIIGKDEIFSSFWTENEK